MREQKDKKFYLSPFAWILYGLLAVLAISSLYFQKEQPWAQCRESLLEQVFSEECTPRANTGESVPQEWQGRPRLRPSI